MPMEEQDGAAERIGAPPCPLAEVAGRFVMQEGYAMADGQHDAWWGGLLLVLILGLLVGELLMLR